MSSSASEINVSDRAQQFAKEVNDVALGADNEEELRIGFENAIRQVAADLATDVDPENERTVLSGRPDAVYGDLIIEYKDPDHKGDWVKEAYEGRNESDSGLIDYMYDIAKSRSHNEEEQEAILDGMVGVGTNGHKIFFCRYRPYERVEGVESGQTPLFGMSRQEATSGIEIIDVYDIREGARTFLTFLRSLSRKPLTSEKLAEFYGPEGDIAQKAVQDLYDALTNSLGEHPRVSTLYNEWERVFGIVYGEEMGQIQDDRHLFGNIYGLEDPEVRPLLFSVHTYYGLLMKMLSTELLSTVRDTPIEEAGLYEPNDDELKRKLSEMEDGKQYERAGLEDFFEAGFFGWYIDVWNEDIAEQIRSMAEVLTGFESATPTIKPEVVRDILKDLYQELVPRVIRHDLGEYLTPDWLAEVTIDETGYEGEGRMLDPACGSGTFLVESINVIRRESDNEGEDLLNEIRNKVVGFDLNPVSVIASRTNYLIALGELAFHSTSFRVPVYQSDSILTPSKYVDVRSMNADSNGEGFRISTREGEFNIPAFVKTDEDDNEKIDREKIENLLSLLNEYVEMDASNSEFLSVISDEDGLNVDENWRTMISELYNDIHGLKKDNRNGVWTSLLRNRLAPEFVDEFEFIIGNPPWVNWESLSEDYREQTKDLFERYGLFTLGGTAGRLGGGKKDVSMLFTYVAIDEYLTDDGKLGFLIPRVNLKSEKTGDGFRRFQLGSGDYLKCVKAHDMAELKPFDAANNTALLVLEKGKETEYPVPYMLWEKTKRGSIDPEWSLDQVRERTVVTEQEAAPVREGTPTSSWLTSAPDTVKTLRRAVGEADYTAHEGSNTGGANGVYWIEILDKLQNGNLRIQNLPEMGRKDIVQREGEIEPDLVYPLLRGRDIDRYSASTELHLVVAQNPEERDGIPERVMRSDMGLRKTYQFLKQFKEPLLERATHAVSEEPFYDMFGIGPYTVAEHKVVWREVSNEMIAAVVGNKDDEWLGSKPIVPAHTAVLIACDSAEEAHYICALLNSIFPQNIVKGYVELHPSPHVMDNLKIPRFDPDNQTHQRLAELSEQAHKNDGDVKETKDEIDFKSASVWGISESEVQTLKSRLENSDES